MYIISTDEWQLIANLKISRLLASMVCVDEKLYVCGGWASDFQSKAIVERYDNEKDEREQQTIVPIPLQIIRRNQYCLQNGCSLRIFKDFFLEISSLPCSIDVL